MMDDYYDMEDSMVPERDMASHMGLSVGDPIDDSSSQLIMKSSTAAFNQQRSVVAKLQRGELEDRYLRLLEETVINTLKIYGVEGERNSGKTGVWLDVESPFPRKICAMGVRASRWVTMHGFALNVDVNLDYFNNIIPCGLANNIVTSLNKEMGDDHIDINKLKDDLKTSFSKSFKSEFI